MREKSSITAQRLLTLYRQAHVINGGWSAVNKIFMNDASAEVLSELAKLSNGFKLAQHIKNLQSGKTKIDSIDSELAPYGGQMEREAPASVDISENDLKVLKDALEKFQPDESHLNQIKDLPLTKSFGVNWLAGIRAAIGGDKLLLSKWHALNQTARAYQLWNRAFAVMSPPVSERARAEIQADLSEYETYLPMFGPDGTKLLARLRTFVSSV